MISCSLTGRAGRACEYYKRLELIMELLNKATSALTLGAKLLADPAVEDATLSSDRVGGTVSLMSSMADQASTAVRTAWSPPADISDQYNAMAMSKATGYVNPQKMVQLKTGEWNGNTDVRTDVVEVNLPLDFWPNNSFPARGPTRYFAYLRTGFTFNIVVNAASGMAGCLLVSYQPKGSNAGSADEYGSYLLYPHILINLATASSGTLKVPYTSVSNYTDTDLNQLGKLRCQVWSKLRVPTGSSTSADVTVFGSLDDLDMQAPRPQVRTKVDIAEGPGTINLANSLSTREAQTFAIGGGSAYPDPTTAGSMKPVEDLTDLLRVPVPLRDPNRLFTWAGTKAAGSEIFQANYNLDNLTQTFRLMSNAYKFYKGAVTIRLTAFNSIFNKGRVKLVVFPLSDVSFTSDQANNGFYTILDLGIQSSAEVTLPFHNWNRIKSVDQQICRIEVHVVNRLQYNAASPSSIDLMLTAQAGDDFDMFVPRDGGLKWESPIETTSTLGTTSVTGATSDIAIGAGLSDVGANGGGPQDELPPAQMVAADNRRIMIFSEKHTMLESFFGRAIYYGEIDVAAKKGIATKINWPQTSHHSVARAFTYWFGEPIIHLYNNTNSVLLASHSYYDPGTPTEFTMVSAGAILIPPKQTMSIVAPWYRDYPIGEVRATVTEAIASGLGWLSLYCEEVAKVKHYWSYKNLQFYFPRAAPNTIPAMDEDEEIAEEEMGGSQRLLLSGDIETNPGPVAELVYRDRGLYKHYGIRLMGNVIHMNSENVLDSVVNGVVKIVRVFDDGLWTSTGEIVDSVLVEALAEESVGLEGRFSADFNCETFAREIMGVGGITQARSLAIFGVILASMCGVAAVQTGEGTRLGQFAKGVRAKFSDVMGSVASIMNGTMINKMISDVSSDVVKNVCKFVVRIVCYGILYCSCPNLLTTGAVMALVGLDLASLEGLGTASRTLFDALLNGEIATAVGALSDFAHENCKESGNYVRDALKEIVRVFETDVPKTESPMKSFNEMSLVGRNVDWWMGVLQKFIVWIKALFHPDGRAEAVEWVESYHAKIIATCCEMDMYVMQAKTSPGKMRDPIFQGEVRATIEDAIQMKKILMTAQCFPLIGQFTSTLSKLQALTFGPARKKGFYRMEPIGIWIGGKAGQGKSFLMLELLRQLAIELGQDPKDVYPHATGSKYFDGYDGQFFHIIDDLGQARDEEDIKLLCQCISSVPFQVPMADLPEKGTCYNSKVVIATTNRTDFQTMALTDAPALDRRFSRKLYIRVSDLYKEKGRLNVAKAQEAKALENGTAWLWSEDSTGTKEVLDLKKLVKEIAVEFKAKNDVVEILQGVYEEGNGDEIESPTATMEDVKLDEAIAHFERTEGEDTGFDCLVESDRVRLVIPEDKRSRMKEWFDKKMSRVRYAWEKFKPWIQFVSIVGAVGTMFLSGYTAYLIWRTKASRDFFQDLKNGVANEKKEKKEAEEVKENPFFTDKGDGSEPERAYNGLSKFVQKRDKKRIFQQGPETAEWVHLTKLGCFFKSGPDITYGVACGGKTMYTYSHMFNCGQTFSPDLVVWNGIPHNLAGTVNTTQVVEVKRPDGIVLPCDLVQITIPTLPWQFKDISRYIAEPEVGMPGVLTYMTASGPYSQEVNCITTLPMFETMDMYSKCNLYGAGIRYVAKTAKGMCGGLLIQKQHGSWKALGIHVAGNGTYGFATRIFPVETPEGMVIDRKPAPSPLFSQSKTKLRHSPLYGLVPSTMSPAPLHPRDTRIEIDPPENLTKFAAEKYRVDVFNPMPNSLERAQQFTIKRIYETTGMTKCIPIIEAMNGVGGLNKLDMRTSAGPVYQKSGVKKSDLIVVTPDGLRPSPRFEHDVSQCIQALKLGSADVLFGANLKDELLANGKVASARTRCIEACGVDYTVAYRMVMGDMYSKLYDGSGIRTGVAVGINPYTEYHDIRLTAFRNMYALDYSKYDGSIPKGLMDAAVEVLATCHEDPDLVRQLHAPVVTSSHWVSDEIWTVFGGMPSGSPCTSVLNSVVNVLLIRSILDFLGHNLEEVHVTCYGDDVLLSTVMPVEGDKLVNLIRDWYGMEATNASKTGSNLEVTWEDATFLKRNFRCFPGTSYTVGLLDLNSIMQKIQWCHSTESFKSQLESATLELAMHGEAVYNEFRTAAMNKMQDLKIYIPAYEVRIKEVFEMFFC
uniref:Genome polyprotein n=1 Tax=Fish-associated picornavirus TaxID=3003962 RepID=A0A9E9GBK0_9VIRU|nr:MAG: polyprotein [Fish-associated picornavirus]